MTIMISAANADVCLSMARILKAHEFYGRMPLVGLAPGSPWPAKCYFDDVIDIPLAGDPGYGASLLAAVNKIKPDIFIPFSEAELAWLAVHPRELENIAAKTIINSPALLDIFLDKKKTADFIRDIGLKAPLTLSPADVGEEHLPVLMKYRRSAGSKNMTIIRNRDQLSGFKTEFGKTMDAYVAQELIDTPDAEYTCALWRFNGVSRHCTLRRTLQGGMTGFAQMEQHVAIDDALNKMASALEGNIFLNVQMRLREGIPYIFEVNPRFSSTVMMRHKIGFQDLIWTLDSVSGRPCESKWKAPLGTMIFRTPDERVVGPEGKPV
ncbi:MAG TPA: hypothetical protein DEA55_03170 [Rhodospirillaceae bacterium]|nr:hypothetical protein [Rhodospirillaceae bacterium]